MELNFPKIFLAAGVIVISAIAGAYIAMHRAAAAINHAVTSPDADDTDALIHSSRHLFGGSTAAGLTGAFWGAVVGILLAILVFRFLDTDKIRLERKMDTGD